MNAWAVIGPRWNDMWRVIGPLKWWVPSIIFIIAFFANNVDRINRGDSYLNELFVSFIVRSHIKYCIVILQQNTSNSPCWFKVYIRAEKSKITSLIYITYVFSIDKQVSMLYCKCCLSSKTIIDVNVEGLALQGNDRRTWLIEPAIVAVVITNYILSFVISSNFFCYFDIVCIWHIQIR